VDVKRRKKWRGQGIKQSIKKEEVLSGIEMCSHIFIHRKQAPEGIFLGSHIFVREKVLHVSDFFSEKTSAKSSCLGEFVRN